jgi:hypothetical protein
MKAWSGGTCRWKINSKFIGAAGRWKKSNIGDSRGFGVVGGRAIMEEICFRVILDYWLM